GPDRRRRAQGQCRRDGADRARPGQPRYQAPPHRRAWRLCLADRQVPQRARRGPGDLVHPGRHRGRCGLYLRAARRLRLCEPQPDRGLRARRRRPRRGRGRVERRSDDQRAAPQPHLTGIAQACRRPIPGAGHSLEADMTALAPRLGNIAGIALPAALLAAALGAIAWQVLPALPGTAPTFAPETVTLPPGELHYRAGGHFFVNGVAVDAPMETTRFDEPLTIMKYQVTAAEYAACVADGACTAADPRNVGEGDVPVTGVNFRDATDYAAWLSARTG